MSMFVDENGRPRTYAVVDPAARQLLATFNWIGVADRGMKDLQKAGHGELTIHNITHPKCPDWLKEMVRADKDYCRIRAEEFDASGRVYRSRAAALTTEAEKRETTAAEWRALSEAAPAPRGPGM